MRAKKQTKQAVKKFNYGQSYIIALVCGGANCTKEWDYYGVVAELQKLPFFQKVKHVEDVVGDAMLLDSIEVLLKKVPHFIWIKATANIIKINGSRGYRPSGMHFVDLFNENYADYINQIAEQMKRKGS